MAKITTEQKESAKKQLEEYRASVKYDTKDYPVELIVEKFKKGEFFVPDYQRAYIWKPKDKSYFIESVLLGLPIPFMFWGECENGRMEIVDGVQRINTLVNFINNELRLNDLEKLTSLNKFRFLDLSTAQQLRFKNKTLRIIVLDAKTTNSLRQDIFSRVNRSGKIANSSEFRRGTYPGSFTDFIDSCQKKNEFKEICPLSKEKELRHEGFELILRFFAFTNNYLEFQHGVAPFLDDFLVKNQESFDQTSYEDEFFRMCMFVRKYFPNGFAKEGIRQVPRVRFEAIAVGVALALREKPDLDITTIEWLNSTKFKELTTSDASNNPGRLKNRVEFVRNALLGRNYDDRNEENL